MKRLPAVDRASEIFLLPMEQKDNISIGIWSMEKQGSPVRIAVAESFDVFRGAERLFLPQMSVASVYKVMEVKDENRLYFSQLK